MKDNETEFREQAVDAAGDSAARANAPTVQLANAPAQEYLAGVRQALSDLPAPEVADILDDVRMHLADLVDEFAESSEPAGFTALTGRLGTPPRRAHCPCRPRPPTAPSGIEPSPPATSPAAPASR